MQRYLIQQDDDRVILENPRSDSVVVLYRNRVLGKSAMPERRGGEEKSLNDFGVCSSGPLPSSVVARVEDRKAALGGAVNRTAAKSVPLHAVFGIYELLSGPYIALIRDSEIAFNAPIAARSLGKGRAPDGLAEHGDDEEVVEFRRATMLAIIPLFKQGRALSEAKQRDEDRYLDLLYTAFSSHVFYFSYRHDVTNSFQRCRDRLGGVPAELLSREDRSGASWARADPRFFWNREVVQPLVEAAADQWVTPVVSAHLEVRPSIQVGDAAFTYLFISRRSRFRAGTRYCRRGLDERGHAANEVETEQVLLHADRSVQAHVQLRGSIPLSWASPVTLKYAPKVIFGAERRSQDAFRSHVAALEQSYCAVARGEKPGEVVFVNLVDRKGTQGALGEAFKEQVDTAMHTVSGRQSTPKMSYVWFDFHAQCRAGRGALDRLLARLRDALDGQGYLHLHADGTIVRRQRGVVLSPRRLPTELREVQTRRRRAVKVTP